MRKILILLFALLSIQLQAQNSLPNTDIYLISFRMQDSSLISSSVTPISNGKLYDNQPFFSFDGNNILYSTVQEGLKPDIYLYSTQSNTSLAFYENYDESVFSPQYTPDDLGYSLIIKTYDGKQTLWKYFFDARTPVKLASGITDVGYYCWIGNDYLAIRRDTKTSLLVCLNIKTGEVKTIADNVGTSFYKVPGENAFYYIKHQPGSNYLMKYDIEQGKEEQVTTMFDGVDDFCATVYGDVWVAYQGSIYAYTLHDKRWHKIYDFTNDVLKKTYRIAVNRTLSQMAVVVKN